MKRVSRRVYSRQTIETRVHLSEILSSTVRLSSDIFCLVFDIQLATRNAVPCSLSIRIQLSISEKLLGNYAYL